MMKNLLKNLTFVAIATFTIATIQAQDTSAYLHMRFENNLNASTNQVGGVVFEAYNGNNVAYTIPYGTGNEAKEGTYAVNYSALTDNTAVNYNLIQNGTNYPLAIQSTTNFGITGSAARTFSAWIRYDNLNTLTNGSHCIMETGDTNSANQGRVTYSFAAANDRIQISVGGGNVNGNYNAAVVEDGNWHHVAFTYPSGGKLSDIKFYLDGVSSSNDGGSNPTTTGFNTTAGHKISIGSTKLFASKWFDGGGIDDLRVYDSVLTPEQITTIYNGSYLSVSDVAFEKNEIKAYPTAVKDILHIDTKSDNSSHINVSDINGKIIIKTFGKSVDMSGLTPGLYIVKVRQDNKVANLKIVKK